MNHKCPHCNSTRTKKSGLIRKKTQRYFCLDCKKYCSTNTPSSIEKRDRKTILVISDTHCGQMFGLTPPQWQKIEDSNFDDYHNRVARYHKKAWQWYQDTLAEIGNVDICICNGDLIDGRGEKSGGTELISTSCIIQCAMAEEVLRKVNFKKETQFYFTFGTDYHTGKNEDYETAIAKTFESIIHKELNLVVNGCKINVKHHIGGGNSPVTRGNSISSTMLWKLLEEEVQGSSKSNLIIRSHVHKSTLRYQWGRWGVITPCLQLESKYSRRLDGFIDYGLTAITVDPKGSVTVKFYTPEYDYFSDCVEPEIVYQTT